MKTKRAETWVATIEDSPGGLATKLDALASAGVNLEFIIARRAPDKPGTGVVFVTPIKGAKQTKAAAGAGFTKSANMHVVRLEGADKPGLGARITEALAEAGLNLRGLSAAAIGKKYVCHIAVDRESDAARLARALRDF